MLLNGVSYRIDGLYTPEEIANSGNVSQTHIKVFDVSKRIKTRNTNDSNDAWSMGFGITPNSTVTVEFRVEKGFSAKFKILSISSC